MLLARRGGRRTENPICRLGFPGNEDQTLPEFGTSPAAPLEEPCQHGGRGELPSPPHPQAWPRLSSGYKPISSHPRDPHPTLPCKRSSSRPYSQLGLLRPTAFQTFHLPSPPCKPPEFMHRNQNSPGSKLGAGGLAADAPLLQATTLSPSCQKSSPNPKLQELPG